MKLDGLKRIIDDVNNGNWVEYAIHFNNSFETFITLISRYGLLDLLNPKSNDLYEHENKILYALVNHNSKKWIPYICDNIINGDLVKEGDDYYLYLNELTDLSSLFYDGSRRDISAADVVKHAFGEDYWEPFWDTTNNVFESVVEELNDENLKKLKQAIFEQLDGGIISAKTEYLQELDEDNDGEVSVTKENFFSGMCEDNETLEYIIDEEVDDIKSDLYRLHSDSYNNAYQEEIYDDIWSELSTFFEGRHIWKTKKTKENKELYYILIKIKDIDDDIITYLNNVKDSEWEEDRLSYLGNYLGMLEQGMKEDVWNVLDFRIPDYPDLGRVTKNINEGFGEFF